MPLPVLTVPPPADRRRRGRTVSRCPKCRDAQGAALQRHLDSGGIGNVDTSSVTCRKCS